MIAGAARTVRTGAPPITPPAYDGLWCECTLAQLDDAQVWLVAGYRAPSPRLALRWMQRQARRLAHLIDPEPDVPWAPVGLLRPVENVLDAERAPDAATALRMWPDDVAEHDQALQAMRDGSLYRFTTADAELRYRLSTRPILVAASPYPAAPTEHRQQGGGGAA